MYNVSAVTFHIGNVVMGGKCLPAAPLHRPVRQTRRGVFHAFLGYCTKKVLEIGHFFMIIKLTERKKACIILALMYAWECPAG